MSDEMAWQKKVDTTKMSGEELEKLNLQNARRPPGQHPGSTLHQRGGRGMKGAVAYPFVLAGVLVLACVGTWAYYAPLKKSPLDHSGHRDHGTSQSSTSDASTSTPIMATHKP